MLPFTTMFLLSWALRATITFPTALQTALRSTRVQATIPFIMMTDIMSQSTRATETIPLTMTDFQITQPSMQVTATIHLLEMLSVRSWTWATAVIL